MIGSKSLASGKDQADHSSYLPVDRHIPPTAAERGEIKHVRSESGYTGKDEMVSIPVLGPEYVEFTCVMPN